MKAKIVNNNGNLIFEINGKRVIPAAYMSYLEDNADYSGFKQAGYNLFCACVYMGDCPVNELSGVLPFNDHVWKSRDKFDFTPVYDSVKRIVGEEKEGYVILRVNLNTPLWWRKENPDELLVLTDGKKYNQSIFSEKWHEDAKLCLTKLVEYVKNFEFSENIVAIQVAGMQTEEWIAMWTPTGTLDISPCAQKAFATWCKKRRKEKFIHYVPTVEETRARNACTVVPESEHAALTEYLHFICDGHASAIREFSAYVKSIAPHLLVGTFYGYIGQIPCDRGHNAVSKLLHDKNIDFFASPFAYVDGRKGAKDWFYHGVMNSCSLAGKLWFLEADVRTHLTQPLHQTHPKLMSGENTVKAFKAPVWMGPSTEEESLWQLLRSFAKVLISKHAYWWFDMWGGWYDTPKMMELMRSTLALYRTEMERPTKGLSEMAVILDEEASYALGEEHFYQTHFHQLVALGFTGVPYDIYHLSDVEKIKKNYKVLFYLMPSQEGEKGNVLVSRHERIKKSERFTPSEIVEFLKKSGVHVWSEGNIVYANSRFVCVTATTEGSIKLNVPHACRLKAFTSGKIYEGKEFTFEFQYDQTELFEVME